MHNLDFFFIFFVEISLLLFCYCGIQRRMVFSVMMFWELGYGSGKGYLLVRFFFFLLTWYVHMLWVGILF